MSKDIVNIVLISFSTMLLILSSYLFFTKDNTKIQVKEQTHVIQTIKPWSPANVRDWLLTGKIENAWVDNFTPKVKADCFVTTLQPDGISIFSYCKLRKKLLVENE